ncbi:ROK family protein [Paenibacillus camelliae]|uniref:ROK family protein n=1 Tax=Paenibacillus camelliae TaxID=512410 RepID=UPI00203B9066|nr:ROK family protein [Paenibacillus camelliae]
MISTQSTNSCAVGIDIGGTKTLVALIDSKGSILDKIEFPSMPETGSDHMMKRIRESVSSLLKSLPSDGQLIGIGIATAGVIDSARKVIVYASNLGWDHVDVGTELEQSFQVPVKLGNDANLAAVAEYVWGTEKEINDLIYVTVSTGIGAGIVSEGRLVKGASDSAGEFGHISIDLKGEPCSCGNVGCLENYCSGTAIARIANERLALTEQGDAWTSKAVLDAAHRGDEAACAIIDEAAFYLGNGIVSLIHLFNPSQIIFGGGVMSAEHRLYEETKRIVEERCLPSMYKEVTIRRTELGKEIGVLGAAGQFFMDDAATR